MRRTLPFAALAVGVVLVTAGPASAHGGRSDIALTTAVTGGTVTVSADVTFLDGDPVPDALVSATALDGARSTAIPMHASGASGHYVGSARVGSGHWQVTVRSTGTRDDADEAIGQSSTSLAVNGSSTPWAGIAGGGAVALLAAGGAVAYARRRRPAASPADAPVAVAG